MSSPTFTPDEITRALAGAWNGSPAPSAPLSISTDSRRDSTGSLFIAIQGELFDGHDHLRQALEKGAAALCVEKSKAFLLPQGVPAILVDSTLAAYHSLARLHRERFKDLKVVALTGSSGKTSTKEMLRAIFSLHFGKDAVLATEGNTNNHLGVPQNLLRLAHAHKVCVLEMGTNHFGEIAPLARMASPDVSLIVSIGRSHLEHFGSVEGVAAEKSDIFKFLKSDGIAVLPASGNCTETLLKAAEAFKVVRFGEGEGSSMVSKYLGGSIEGSSFMLEDLSSGQSAKVSWHLSGRHQAGNAAGAAAAAISLGVPLDEIANGLASCSLPGMRMKVSSHSGATWINDAYNANPDSMAASLEWISDFADPGHLVLMLGDMRELGDGAAQAHFDTLSLAIEKFPASRIVAVGPFMAQAAASLASPNISIFQDSQSAASAASSLVSPGDTVFLKASRGTRLELVEPQS